MLLDVNHHSTSILNKVLIDSLYKAKVITKINYKMIYTVLLMNITNNIHT